ncbi:MAG: hypothetical protein K2H01_08295, partial [Ruminococcus sp.]|nr:hypothetical protein [Ruminococcus sp.]
YDTIYQVWEFFVNILFGCMETFLSNKFLVYFLVTPIAAACIYYVGKFVFDVRDEFSDFNRFKDYFRAPKNKYNSYYRSRKKSIDMDEVYRRARENADYKHRLKMEELNTFKENENLRHQHKHEENEMYKKSFKPNSDKSKGNYKPIDKSKLDISVDD